jgi:hypothetical protein
MKNSIKNALYTVTFCFLFLIIGALTACKSSNAPLSTQTEVNTITTEIVVKDTVFVTQKDSSYYKAWLDCSDGNVIIKDTVVMVQPGKFIKAPKVRLLNNQLKVDCYSEAQRLFAQWKETYVLENKQKEIKVSVPYKVPLTYLEQTQRWCGRIFMVLAALAIVYCIMKLKKNM